MTATSDSHPVACANCATPLQGAYCHQCGQTAHSPVRSFAHAVEEVFESFWHLDGRIFRTLRRLLVPGGLADDYLHGRRAPYVAPMRLFVILCVLTFFVGKGAVNIGDVVRGDASGDATTTSTQQALARATSIEEVRRIRDDALAGLEQARDQAGPGMVRMRPVFERGIAAVHVAADRRMVALGGVAEAPAGMDPDAPLVVSVADDDAGWMARQLRRIQENAPRLQKDPELFKYAFLGSVPTALFVLVPLFALLLTLFYVTTGRFYLEHLVVALYSHAFLCLALLGQFALVAAGRWIMPHAAPLAAALDWVALALWLWMPVYLLLMQKRVYRQGWPLTTLKFFGIGGLYAGALMLCAMGLAVVSLVRL
ncbi:DUF3667 domain-containing protein [Xanthomonas sp. XNM01]|uniref:DUF3667 domain-containing protein n=1 Tax=Xanthomonas sp. XNM01 TaxID=2769289 RepID=UPI00177F8FF6|nr:DUF3667 domain-containing protein [Xanthomonas sp. XNM01]MBD9370663.1 DUF3667 domain-containing protein [Xanthomonas sp. XNM01]